MVKLYVYILTTTKASVYSTIVSAVPDTNELIILIQNKALKQDKALFRNRGSSRSFEGRHLCRRYTYPVAGHCSWKQSRYPRNPRDDTTNSANCFRSRNFCFY